MIIAKIFLMKAYEVLCTNVTCVAANALFFNQLA